MLYHALLLLDLRICCFWKKFFDKIKQFFVFCLFAYPQLSANLVLDIDANESSSYDGSGALINDLSSSGNNLKIVNDVTHVSDSNGFFSFNFDGSADYLELTLALLITFPVELLITPLPCWSMDQHLQIINP